MKSTFNLFYGQRIIIFFLNRFNSMTYYIHKYFNNLCNNPHHLIFTVTKQSKQILIIFHEQCLSDGNKEMMTIRVKRHFSHNDLPITSHKRKITLRANKIEFHILLL